MRSLIDLVTTLSQITVLQIVCVFESINEFNLVITVSVVTVLRKAYVLLTNP